MSTDKSKVLFKINLDSRLEPEWIGPKLFEHRLISYDKASKLQWAFLDLCQLKTPQDLCQKCDKLSTKSIDNGHLCGSCINNNFGKGCYGIDDNFEQGIHLFSTRSKKPYIIRFKSLKLELISDSNVIEAFKIVNPDGGISSHPIIDEITNWYNLVFPGSENNYSSHRGTISKKEKLMDDNFNMQILKSNGIN